MPAQATNTNRVWGEARLKAKEYGKEKEKKRGGAAKTLQCSSIKMALNSIWIAFSSCQHSSSGWATCSPAPPPSPHSTLHCLRWRCLCVCVSEWVSVFFCCRYEAAVYAFGIWAWDSCSNVSPALPLQLQHSLLWSFPCRCIAFSACYFSWQWPRAKEFQLFVQQSHSALLLI